MRILQVIPVFSAPFGGPVTVVRSISKELAKRHDVTVYTTTALDHKHDLKNSQFKITSDGYRVVHFPRVLKFTGFNFSPAMAKALQDTVSEYDVIHLHSWRHFQDLVVHHYAKKNNIPYILQTHGSLPRIMPKKRLKWIYDIFFGYRLLRDASMLIALNHMEVNQYREMGMSQEKIAIIPNGIDLSEYTNLPPKGCFKKKFGIKEEEKIVLYLGRIHKIKGIDILVKSFANIIRKLEDVRLVIVGPDDGYLDKIKFLIETKNIKNKVLITGPLYGKDKLESYIDSDVYVLPSKYEIWGITVLEAYSCCKSVIASRVGGLKDLVIDGVTGLLFTPKDIGQLEESLLFLLENDTRAEQMGVKGKQLVKENFTIENVVYRLEVLYKEIAIRMHA